MSDLHREIDNLIEQATKESSHYYVKSVLLKCKSQLLELESKLRIAESAIAYTNEINSQLEHKLRIAEEALYFYGNEDNWQPPDNFVPFWTIWDDGDNIGNHKAKEALQKIRGEACVE
jgi:predicted transglutaminase-like cysteine proteinase